MLNCPRSPKRSNVRGLGLSSRASTSHRQSALSMRTTLRAIGISALLLAVGNVMLLLLRSQKLALPNQSSVQMTMASTTLESPVEVDTKPEVEQQPDQGLVSSLLRWLGFESHPSPRQQLLEESDIPAAIREGLSRCPNVPARPSESRIIRVESVWQLQRIGTELIYIYTAYYDDRPAAGVLPSIRILALSTFRREVPIYCAVWYQADITSRPLVVRATVNYEAGTGYGYDRQVYREYAYICPLPVAGEPFPTHVSVSSETCAEHTRYTTLVEVRRTPRTETPPIEFGVCVTAGYGYVPAEVLVEWVELNRMFGVAEFNLYDTWYASNMSATFEYYTSRGLLLVHQLPHPRANHSSWFFNKVRNVRIIALNDCQLRNMYRYRYCL